MTIDINGHRCSATAARLASEAAKRTLLSYARRHRIVFWELSRLIIQRPWPKTNEALHCLLETVPVIGLPVHPPA